MGEPLRLTIDSSLAELAVVVERFDRFATEEGLSAEIRGDVHLALEEVITNVIKHGYKGRPGHGIGLEIAVAAGEVVICVEDAAAAFNPLQAAAPDLALPLALKQPGGLGIHLVKQVMDRLDYERTADKNRLTLRKRLPEGRHGHHGTAGQ